MKTFEYRGFNGEGHACRGLVEALSMKEARERLIQKGIFAEKVSPTGRKSSLRLEQRAIFYRELGSLLAAGFPMIKAFDTLIELPEMGDANVVVAGIRDRVREGSSLADALAASSRSVTPFEHAIIQSAERSATVEIMLERLASFLEEQERLMDRIRGAMVYPLVVLVVGICVAVIMLGVLVPKAQEMFAGSELPLSLPMLTRFMIGMGTAMMTWGPVLVAAVVIAVLSVRRKLATDADFRMGWDRALFRAPLLGRGRAILANLRFSRTMAILLRGGVPLVDGIVLAGKATGSMWIGTLAEDAGEFIRHGGSLSDAVRRIPPLALSLPGWLQVGETSGNLEQLLDSASQRYQSQWERHIGTCLNFLEPLLIILVGGFVLVVTLSVLMPIISMRQMVGR